MYLIKCTNCIENTLMELLYNISTTN